MVECEFVSSQRKRLTKVSFNRYMVECEFHLVYSPEYSGIRFNRYMVECELFKTSVSDAFDTVLIDTWWNVNQRILCKRRPR